MWNKIESDVYQTVCSFLNRFGGDIFLGVLDDGTVSGVSEKAAPDLVKNFINCVSNPALFYPTVYLVPEIIKYEEKTGSVGMKDLILLQSCSLVKMM